MDLQAIKVIDIPTFIKKFIEKFLQKQAGSVTNNFNNFLNIGNDVLTSYFALIKASVNFLHRDGSVFIDFSADVSQNIIYTVN